MKHLIFIGLLINFNLIFAQNKLIKNYSGNFDDGTATYSYYENVDSERIYQGAFSFKGNVVKYDGLKLNFSGSFSDNLKDGVWSFAVKNFKSPVKELLSAKDEAMINMSAQLLMQFGASREKVVEYINGYKTKVVYKTYNSVLKGKYILGKMDGNWTFSESFIGGDAPILGTKNYKINLPIFSSVNFKDNILTGSFLFKQGDKYSLSGQFNENGVLHGKWIIKWVVKNEEFESIREYENGELIKMIERNTSTGKILFRENDPKSIGLKVMTYAISFWIKPDFLGFLNDGDLNIDDIPISDRNYMFKFDKGIIKPNLPIIK